MVWGLKEEEAAESWEQWGMGFEEDPSRNGSRQTPFPEKEQEGERQDRGG